MLSRNNLEPCFCRRSELTVQAVPSAAAAPPSSHTILRTLATNPTAPNPMATNHRMEASWPIYRVTSDIGTCLHLARPSTRRCTVPTPWCHSNSNLYSSDLINLKQLDTSERLQFLQSNTVWSPLAAISAAPLSSAANSSNFMLASFITVINIIFVSEIRFIFPLIPPPVRFYTTASHMTCDICVDLLVIDICPAASFSETINRKCVLAIICRKSTYTTLHWVRTLPSTEYVHYPPLPNFHFSILLITISVFTQTKARVELQAEKLGSIVPFTCDYARCNYLMLPYSSLCLHITYSQLYKHDILL